MLTDLGGPIQPEMMKKFRLGTYALASAQVQKTWKLVMLEFLPRMCKDGWGKKQDKVLLAEDGEISAAMEAMVCWYVDMYGTLRWVPENEEDVALEEAGNAKEKRGKRTSAAEKARVKAGPGVFAQYWSAVQIRRAGSKDWDKALLEAAAGEKASENENATAATVGVVASQGRKKRGKPAEEEVVIPTTYKFGDDGKIVIATQTATV